MPAEKKGYIITFKRKDKRKDKKADKQQLFSSATKTEVNFFTADHFARGVPVPSAMPLEMVAYDVNTYEAPILMAYLTEKEKAALEADENVARVEEDGPVYALDGFAGLENLMFEDQPMPQAETVPAGISQINAPAAWDASRGKAVKVAILDTGIDNNHPDLTANFKFGVSFVPDESNSMDYNGHGTHVAGTVAAAINGSGVVGVAPAAYLYAVKVLSRTGSGQWSWLIAGIDWAVNKKGMHILNMSLGGSAPQAVKDMCDAAFSKGALLIAAAGNNGGAIGDPARYDSVVAVTAIDGANVIAPFSSRGPEAELCAPGVGVLSTLPGGGFGTKSGTSMASPHVSGAAALAWGSHRYANNVTIRRLLAWTAFNLGDPGRDNLYGFGRVDAAQAAIAFGTPPAIPGIP